MVSVIIPTYNEAKQILELISYLFRHGGSLLHEIIVVDAGSTDNTLALAQEAGAKIFVSPVKSRAAQMNLGAEKSEGAILFFVHADAFPPATFSSDITHATREDPEAAGCYRMKFKSDKKLLRLNSYFTRYNGLFSGGGDQTLFLTRTLFERLGKFNERFVIMEDFDFTRRAKKHARFRILSGDVSISARKYDKNSYLRVNLVNLLMIILFRSGVDPLALRSLYRRMLH